jgi:hypothetical protein
MLALSSQDQQPWCQHHKVRLAHPKRILILSGKLEVHQPCNETMPPMKAYSRVNHYEWTNREEVRTSLRCFVSLGYVVEQLLKILRRGRIATAVYPSSE